MNKVVINTCYGGFFITQEALQWMVDNGLEENYYSINPEYNPDNDWSVKYQWDPFSIPRHHPLLVRMVEEFGSRAKTMCSKLEVREIEGDKYRICEYDGREWIETPDSIDWITI